MSSEKSPYRKGGYRPMRKFEKKARIFNDRFPGKADLARNFKKGRGKHNPRQDV